MHPSYLSRYFYRCVRAATSLALLIVPTPLVACLRLRLADRFAGLPAVWLEPLNSIAAVAMPVLHVVVVKHVYFYRVQYIFRISYFLSILCKVTLSRLMTRELIIDLMRQNFVTSAGEGQGREIARRCEFLLTTIDTACCKPASYFYS